jgi:pantothenate synthetase
MEECKRIAKLKSPMAKYLEVVAMHIAGRVLVAVACRTTERKTRLIDNITLGGDF